MIKVTVINNLKRETIIIDANTSLKAAMEQVGVDYSRGVTNLDGSPLGAGDLNKTFAQFGVTDKCFLVNVIKSDNAARITVVGDAVVVRSSLKLADIELVRKYRSDALTLRGGEDGKEPMFTIDVTSGSGNIGQYGAVFPKHSDDSHGAAITMLAMGVEGDIKEYLADELGAAVTQLSKLEETIPGVIESIKAERKAIMDGIEIAE